MGKEKRDRHFPAWQLDNPIRRLYDNPNEFCAYVTSGQVVADLGCGPGYHTLALAESVGPEGKVFAVDSDEKAIRVLEKKAKRHGYHNIETHISSAHNLDFIKDGSIDFVLANGLLCSMAPQYHGAAVNEIKRILKANGKAYLSLGSPPPLGFVGDEEWEKILGGFKVEQRGGLGQKWAVVSRKES